MVAFFEALKGIVALAGASGALALVHTDLHAVAVRLLEHAHLNPASRYPGIFLDAAANLHDAKLRYLAAGAALYASLRLVEAYGLFNERAWAEWLAAASATVYLPFEVYNFARHPSLLSVGVFIANLAVVAIMVAALRRRRRRAASAAR